MKKKIYDKLVSSHGSIDNIQITLEVHLSFFQCYQQF